MPNLNSIWFNLSIGHSTPSKRYVASKKLPCLVRTELVFQVDIQDGIQEATKKTLLKMFEGTLEGMDDYIRKQRSKHEQTDQL